jgi:iron-sulfur cluster assembly protein
VKPEFPITITPSAMQELRKLLAKEAREGVFLRLGVKGGGCSGLEYVMKLDTQPYASDLLFQDADVIVRCDAKSANFLRGATFDYTGNLIGGGFSFVNPNAEKSCGCGTSFTPKRP